MFTSQRPHGRPLPLHTCLLPTIPVLALWSGNAHETTELALPIKMSLGLSFGAITLLVILTVVQRDLRRGGIVASLVTLALTTYGHWFPPEADHRIGLVATGLVVVTLIAVTSRISAPAIRTTTTVLNTVALALVLANAVLIVGATDVRSDVGPESRAHGGTASGRDVWYIVPDRHPSFETLRGLGLPVEDVTNRYQTRAFEILSGARSNYPDTRRSLAAAWNARLLPEDTGHSMVSAVDALRDPWIGRAFREAGYEYIHVGSWFDATEGADSASANIAWHDRAEFYQAFEWTTVIPAVRHWIPIGLPGFAVPRLRHHAHANHQLASLKQLARHDDPMAQFVLAHVLLPHPEYVFHEDGSYRATPVAPEDRDGAYAEQLAFTHERLLELVDILQAREDPPIILIMSDEGVYPHDVFPQQEEDFDATRMSPEELLAKVSVFAALFDPADEIRDLPQSITPARVTHDLLEDLLAVDQPSASDLVMVQEAGGDWVPHSPAELPDTLINR